MPEPAHPNQLTPQQETAIDLIFTGKNDSDVAHAIGKSRSTVNIWRNHDPLFIATLNDRRQQIWGGQLNRLNNLVAEAVNVLQDGLHDSDIKVRLLSAVHILKATGVYGATVPDSQQKTDPAEIAADREIKEKARKNRLDMYKDSFTRRSNSSSAEKQSHLFADEQERRLASELLDASIYFKGKTEKEKIAYWEQLLPTYAEIPRETLDTLDNEGLRQLVLDFVEARDTYLKTLKDDLISTANSDPQIWENYTEEIHCQVEVEVQRAKEKTDTVLQIFLDTWESHGGDAAQLLDQPKRKGRRPKKNPMMLSNGFKIPLSSDPQTPTLSKPSETDT